MSYKTHRTHKTYRTHKTHRTYKTYNPHIPHNRKKTLKGSTKGAYIHNNSLPLRT